METLNERAARNAKIAAVLKISEPRVYQVIARVKAIGKEYRKNNG